MVTALVAVAIAGLGGLGLLVGPTPAAAAPTTGCRQVGGGTAGGGGPQRATVVVDTGSGPVWSACISFSGTISGITALELAEATITDLDPVYDGYVGEGRAVCRLRDVGTDPPDCLGKSVDYWGFWVNGTYARAGAGSVTVHDGDVHAWRYGTGATPRSASQGTEAYTAPPTTTTRPPTTTTAPPSKPGGGGGLHGSSGATTVPPAGDGATTTPVPGGSTTTVPGSATTTTEPEATAVAGKDEDRPGDAADDEGNEGDGGGDSEVAAGAAAGSGASGSTAVPTSDDGGPGASSLVGFAIALAVIVGAGLFIRSRRAAPST